MVGVPLLPLSVHIYEIALTKVSAKNLCIVLLLLVSAIQAINRENDMAVTRRHIPKPRPKPVELQSPKSISAVRKFFTPSTVSRGKIKSNTIAMCICRKKESSNINGASKASKKKITMTITREKIEVVNEKCSSSSSASPISTSNSDEQKFDNLRIWPKLIERVRKSRLSSSSSKAAKTTSSEPPSKGGRISARMRSESEGDYSPELRMRMRNEEECGMDNFDERKRQMRKHRRLRRSHRRIWQQKKQQRKLLSHAEIRYRTYTHTCSLVGEAGDPLSTKKKMSLPSP